MPKLIIDGKPVHVRWLKEWDRQILLIEKTFKKSHTVDWKRALEEGYFKGLPALKLRDYSHRLTSIKIMRKPGSKEKRREYNQQFKHIQSKHGMVIRNRLYREVPLSPLRKKHDCLPRDLWTEEQHDILKALASDCRRGKTQVDWEGVMASSMIPFLPKKYQNDLPLLRKYYQVLKHLDDPKLLKKRCEDALRWKSENKARYLKNNRLRKKKIHLVTREYLLKKIPRY